MQEKGRVHKFGQAMSCCRACDSCGNLSVEVVSQPGKKCSKIEFRGTARSVHVGKNLRNRERARSQLIHDTSAP